MPLFLNKELFRTPGQPLVAESCMTPRGELAAEEDRSLLPQDWQSHHEGWGREPSSCLDAG